MTRHFQENIRGLPLNLFQSDHVPSACKCGLNAHFFFRPQDNSSIALFDPDGARREFSADSASGSQMEDAIIDARARLDDWTARKAQWCREHEQGRTTGSVKPQLNDRPEVTARTASLQETRGTA